MKEAVRHSVNQAGERCSGVWLQKRFSLLVSGLVDIKQQIAFFVVKIPVVSTD